MAITLAREWETKQDQIEHTRETRSLPSKQTPQNATVVRSDGAWSPLGTTAGLGWIILSPTGHLPFHKRALFVRSAIMAEGLAMLEAVKAGSREHLKTVVFESDSAILIKSLNTGSCLPELYGVAADILSFVSVFDSAVFSWISRESNGQADGLAKFALNVVDVEVVDESFMASN